MIPRVAEGELIPRGFSRYAGGNLWFVRLPGLLIHCGRRHRGRFILFVRALGFNLMESF